MGPLNAADNRERRGRGLPWWRRADGEGKIGCVLWSLLVVVGVMAAARMVPVKIATAQLKDHMDTLAQTQPRATSRYLEESIFHRAKELDLPLRRQDVRVQKHRDRIIMDVDLDVPLDFYVHTFHWKIQLHLDRDIFYF